MALKRRFCYVSSDDEDFYLQAIKRVTNLQEKFSGKEEKAPEEDQEEDPEEELMTEFELPGECQDQEEDPEEEIEELDEEDRQGNYQISNAYRNHLNLSESLEPDMGFTDEVKRENKRFWNVDDEITVLKGIIDFNRIKRSYPFDGLGDFYDYIKNFFHVNYSRKQLHTKIRTLKNKYQKNKQKAEDEKNIFFSKKPQQKELFLLSQKVWGSGALDIDTNDKSANEYGKNTNSAMKGKAVEEDFWSMYPLLNESLKLEQFEYTLSSFVKQRITSIGNSKAKELEDKWKKLEVAETELKLKRAQLIQEQTQLILRAQLSNF